MLSKEEIEKDKRIFYESIKKLKEIGNSNLCLFINNLQEGNTNLLEIMFNKYMSKIEKLEAREQKLIENLEQIQKESAENISPQTMKKYATVRMEEIDDETYILLAMHRIGFAGEILAILKGEKEV